MSKKEECQIRVHVIEARDLKGRDRSGTSDPVCFVRVFDKKRSTTIVKKTNSCVWDQLWIFKFKLYPEEFLKGQIQLDVFDANTVTRNTLIGSHVIEIGRLHESPGHQYHKVWLALADQTDRHEGIQGYVQASLAALRPGDEAPNIADDDASVGRASSLQSMILVPPKIRAKDYHLIVDCYLAEQVAKMDISSPSDPFISVDFAANYLRTRTIKDNANPVWNEQLCLPITLPSMSDLITMQLVDEDPGSNEVIGTVFFKFSDIRKEPRLQWINFYGSPHRHTTLALTRDMNLGKIPGNSFRGRALVGMRVQKVKEGKLSTSRIAPVAGSPMEEYVLRLDLHSAYEVPVHLSLRPRIRVELEIGEHKLKSNVVKMKKKRVEFHQPLPELVASFPADVRDISSIFLNVYHVHKRLGSKPDRVAFVRIEPSSLLAAPLADCKPQWQEMIPDQFNVKEEVEGGFILFGLAMAKSEAMATVPRPPIVPPTFKPFELRCHFFQGRDLPASDKTGLSDCFCEVHAGGRKVRTGTVRQTCYPVWMETVVLKDVEFPVPLEVAPMVTILAFDKDRFSNDLLGLFHVELSKMSREYPPSPVWIPLNTQGDVLVSFQLIPAGEAARFPPQKLIPKSEGKTLLAYLVGARNLSRHSMASLLSKPQVEVSCELGQRDRPMVASAASKHPSSKNPNFLEVLRLNLNVPIDPLFSPPVHVRVLDVGLPGVVSLIGGCTQSLEALINNQASCTDLMNPVRVENVGDAMYDDDESSSEEEAGHQDGRHVDGEAIAEVTDPSTPLLSTSQQVPGRKKHGHGRRGKHRHGHRSHKEDKKEKGPEKGFGHVVINLAGRTLPELPPISLMFGGAEEAEEESVEVDRRPHLDKEWEATYSSPFVEYALHRGKAVKKTASQTVVGSIKGRFYLQRPGEPSPDFNLGILGDRVPLVVRLYVLRGHQLFPKDASGSSDPFLMITRGPKPKRTDTFVRHRLKKTLNPEFFRCYEVEVALPQQFEVTVAVWDYDRLGRNELIGATQIDIENRYLSPEWRNQALKPLEFRSLWNPSCSTPQGTLELWIDIMTPEEALGTPMIEIGPPKPKKFELRLVIWRTKNVKFRDKGMSDIFVTGHFEGHKHQQKTDTHWRSENGEGEFNWRMVFPVTIPCSVPRFKLQVWDKDMLSPNDVIAEANIDLGKFLEKAYKSKERTALSKQFISLGHPNYEGEQGKVECSLEIIPLEEAQRSPVGIGRGEPNRDPFLPEPDRPDTSFNILKRPDKFITKVLWREHRWKIFGCCVCIGLAFVIGIAVLILNLVGIV